MTLPIPSQRTWSTYDMTTAAMLNANVRDAVNYLLNPPIFLGYQSVAQSIANSTFTSITFDQEVFDTYGGHSTTSNTSRYTAQLAGYHWVDASVAWASNASGRRMASLWVNGNELGYTRNEVTPSSAALALSCDPAALVYLNAGDYVEVKGFQSSGAALNTAPSPLSMSVLWVHA